MSTTSSLPPSQTGPSPSPSQSDQGVNSPSYGQLPSISLCLYIFSVILVLFLIILSGLVLRSVRRRRRRRNGVLHGLTSGAHGSAEKPVMWEASIDPIDDGEKGWAGMWPVALAMPGPISDVKYQPQPQHPSPWRSRLHFPSLSSRISSNPHQTSHPPEPLTPMTSSPPVQLTVLVAMPIPSPHGEAGKEKEGPPVVELGVTRVSYAPNVP